MQEKAKNASQNEDQTEKAQLPWHKPMIERLSVALDTAYNIGSTTDFGATGSTPG